MSRTVLITGANRGLGQGVAHYLAGQGWHIIVAARHLSDAIVTADAIKAAGQSAEPLELDVANADHIARLASEPPRIDALVNNAGVAAAWDGLETAKIGDARTSLETNALGPFQLIQMFAPAMKAQGWGRIVNVSSGMGGLAEMGSGAPAYRISKTALNAITKFASEDLKGSGILVNSVCPGWVKTRMGGDGAPRSLEQGVASIVWAVELPDDGPTGGFYRDGESLAW
jgi:NAD(P)-dependent dehydrogenase (short-subunit alcohol dehydrogenase family)